MNFTHCAAGALVAAAALVQAADPLSEVFRGMDTAASHFKGMSADIEETVHLEIVDDNNVSNGTIKLKRNKPGDVRFLVEFQKPDQRAAAYAGNEIHVYNPKTNIEQIYDVSTKKAVIEQAILLGFGATSAEIKSSYDVSYVGAETVGGQAAAHIKLVPKTKEMQAQVKQADLWISDSAGVPIQQKFLTSSSGNYNLFRYSHMKLEAISDGDLKLKLPKGVQKKTVGH
jgi:outer membrane lipoprotein-sorting protein